MTDAHDRVANLSHDLTEALATHHACASHARTYVRDIIDALEIDAPDIALLKARALLRTIEHDIAFVRAKIPDAP